MTEAIYRRKKEKRKKERKTRKRETEINKYQKRRKK